MIDRAIEFLRNNKDVAFATVEGNKPKIRVFQIMKIEDRDLFFATSPKKGVFKQLQANKSIEILAMQGDVSVRCVGNAVFDVKDETKRWIYEHNGVLSRLYDDYNAIEYFRMQLICVDYYDLRPTPPILKHIDLVTGTIGDGFVGDKYSK